MTKACRPRRQPTVFVFHDRYSSTGRERPAPGTGCAKCEGMGFYPDMKSAREKKLAHDDVPFIRCAQCNGTGRRTP